MTSTSRIAPIDAIWVCSACGKTHTDRYGIDGEGSHGWDESCMLNAVLCKRGNIKPGDRVTHAAEPFRSIDRRRTMMEPKWTIEPSERDRKMAREYLDSVTGMSFLRFIWGNPEDHAAQWFAAARTEERERLKEKLSLRLNNHLIEMKPGYDDSISGFNEAWNVVQSVFSDAARIKSGQ